jgi:catechol 2,3-dioxygenase
MDWTPGHFEPEDSFYLWGPEAPDEFVINYESKSIVRMP